MYVGICDQLSDQLVLALKATLNFLILSKAILVSPYAQTTVADSPL